MRSGCGAVGPRQGEAGALGQSYGRVAPVPLPTAGGIGAALAGGRGADFPGTSRGVGVCEGSASPEAQDTAVPRGASPPASFLARPDSRVGGGWLLSVAGGEDFPITTSLGAARSWVFTSLSKQDSNRDLNSEYEGALPGRATKRTAGKLMGSPVSRRREPWGWFPWITPADPHKRDHFRLRAAAASFPTPSLIRSPQNATRHVPGVGGFVEPEMMVIATDGLSPSAAARAAVRPRTDRRTPPHTYTRGYLPRVNIES